MNQLDRSYSATELAQLILENALRVAVERACPNQVEAFDDLTVHLLDRLHLPRVERPAFPTSRHNPVETPEFDIDTVR
jgi:hypothetical protein